MVRHYIENEKAIKSICGRFEIFNNLFSSETIFFNHTTTRKEQVTCKFCLNKIKDVV